MSAMSCSVAAGTRFRHRARGHTSLRRAAGGAINRSADPAVRPAAPRYGEARSPSAREIAAAPSTTCSVTPAPLPKIASRSPPTESAAARRRCGRRPAPPPRRRRASRPRRTPRSRARGWRAAPRGAPRASPARAASARRARAARGSRPTPRAARTRAARGAAPTCSGSSRRPERDQHPRPGRCARCTPRRPAPDAQVRRLAERLVEALHHRQRRLALVEARDHRLAEAEELEPEHVRAAPRPGSTRPGPAARPAAGRRSCAARP